MKWLENETKTKGWDIDSCKLLSQFSGMTEQKEDADTQNA